jgi:hypothetical protein
VTLASSISMLMVMTPASWISMIVVMTRWGPAAWADEICSAATLYVGPVSRRPRSGEPPPALEPPTAIEAASMTGKWCLDTTSAEVDRCLSSDSVHPRMTTRHRGRN